MYKVQGYTFVLMNQSSLDSLVSASLDHERSGLLTALSEIMALADELGFDDVVDLLGDCRIELANIGENSFSLSMYGEKLQKIALKVFGKLIKPENFELLSRITSNQGSKLLELVSKTIPEGMLPIDLEKMNKMWKIIFWQNIILLSSCLVSILGINSLEYQSSVDKGVVFFVITALYIAAITINSGCISKDLQLVSNQSPQYFETVNKVSELLRIST